MISHAHRCKCDKICRVCRFISHHLLILCSHFTRRAIFFFIFQRIIKQKAHRLAKKTAALHNNGNNEIPTFSKIIDIVRALCYYKQADKIVCHTFRLWRSTQEAEGAPLLRE